MASLVPPPGRYGTERSPAARTKAVVGMWVLGLAGLGVAVWFGIGAGSAPVTFKDVGFTLQDGAVEIVYDVIRPDASIAVSCRLQALNNQHAEVGVLTVQVPGAQDRVQRLSSTVKVSEPAVTGVVDRCWVP